MDRLSSRTDVLSGSALAIVALAYYAASRGLPEAPAFFPRILAVTLFLLGATIAIRGRHPSASSPETKGWRVGVAAITLVYALVWTHVGFVASTLVYTGSVSYLLGQRGLRLAIVTGVTTLSIYGMLELGLGVPLP